MVSPVYQFDSKLFKSVSIIQLFEKKSFTGLQSAFDWSINSSDSIESPLA